MIPIELDLRKALSPNKATFSGLGQDPNMSFGGQGGVGGTRFNPQQQGRV